MSTRVQKGNTVFRPVTKARTRNGSDTRYTPVSSDARSASVASTSMPPPATFPQRPSSHLSSAEDAFSDTTQGYVADTPTALTPSPVQNRHTVASPISVPTRESARPPAIQSFTSTSRVSTPVPPRIQSGAHLRDPISITMPIPTPTEKSSAIQHPGSNAAPLEPDVTPAPAAASSTVVSVPTNIPSESAAAAISDAQIDPALLEAVVTVLQHVNQTEDQPSQPTEQQAAPPSQIIVQENDTQTRPVLRKRGRTNSKQGSGDAGPSNTSGAAARPRRAVRRPSRPEAERSAEEDDEQSRPNRRRKRSSNDSSTGKRPRAPSVPPFDPEADPGEELDPTAVTMADLCDDTGRGRVSSKVVQIMTNHTAWRAANREKRARMRALMDAKKYGRDADEEENVQTQDTTAEQPQLDDNIQPVAGPSSERAPATEATPAEGEKGDDFDYTQAMATSRYNVQVRVGPNGETIIDESSLFVDRQEEDETVNYTHVEESDTTKFVNSMSYSKKLRGSRWSAEETELFYDALSQFGENYELISYVLPGRDRKACKNKFKAEDKRNFNRITFCLNNRRPYDMQTLARMTGKDFSGPPPEIRAPALRRMPGDTNVGVEDDDTPPDNGRKESTTPTLDAAELVDEVEEVDVEM